MARRAGRDLLVGRVRLAAAGVAGDNRFDAFQFVEGRLHAPETSPRKGCFFENRTRSGSRPSPGTGGRGEQQQPDRCEYHDHLHFHDCALPRLATRGAIPLAPLAVLIFSRRVSDTRRSPLFPGPLSGQSAGPPSSCSISAPSAAGRHRRHGPGGSLRACSAPRCGPR